MKCGGISSWWMKRGRGDDERGIGVMDDGCSNILVRYQYSPLVAV